MKYSELIDFEPIESVIQIRDADELSKAKELVETFVISERMAEQLVELVLPNMQFETPADNKGILVVGNYGTGKSHLMALISALAEHAELASACRNPAVAKAAESISGKFKVIRMEIGATEMGLRDIICTVLQEHLSAMGVEYVFPDGDKITNNKDSIVEMMGKFAEKYPDKGLLLMTDELLDYLRTRNNQQIVLDLGFMRELGEVCKNVRFRVFAGLQESLFDNPKFQFVADSVRRVKDRFQQVRIVRQDIAYVVSERLLTKSDKQKAWIREHLQQFLPMYDSMAERIEEFVSLFPVHPAYLDTFELISIAEKREILKTLSFEIKQVLEQDVPSSETGMISYDSYWGFLRDNASLKADPNIRDVINKSNVLESRIKQAFTRKAYTPMAIRLAHGLSVHRLSTDDINAKIGPTASELRDDLCLYLETLPEKTSDFLRTTVESCLKEIVKTMSGQFITHNKENDQYYLDLEKVVDYDAEIDKRAAVLSDSDLDDYYFDALKRVMECTDQTYVTGYKIWEHEIPWVEHKVGRRGYMFFGAPNERSTAQPPRDFYVYFMQPFQPPKFKDEKLADEVFFRLKQPDEDFMQALRLYAGARAMAAEAGSATRKEYENKATELLKQLTKWLGEHLLTAFEVTHQGSSKKMVEFLKNHKTGNQTVSELVNLAGSIALGPSFEDQYPEYPTFSTSLTASNMKDAAVECVRMLTGGLATNLAKSMLDGLELLDGDKIRPHESRYAKSVLNKLNEKPQGQVLNRSELITDESGVEREIQYNLEPELLALLLLSLVHSGDITISLVGRSKVDASSLAENAKTPIEDFCKFKHVERPKDIPISALVALFEMVGLPEGLIKDPNTRDTAIKQLREKNDAIVKRAVVAKNDASGGLPCWGHELLPVDQRKQFTEQLDSLQQSLERLQAFNTPGKLKNFPFDVEKIKLLGKDLEVLGQLEQTRDLVNEIGPLASYLTTAKAILPESDKWSETVEEVRSEWQPQLLDPEKRNAADFRQKILAAIDKQKKAYQEHYLKLHEKSRLGINDDKKKQNLLKDERMERLKSLSHVALLPHASLTEQQNKLAGLKPCYTLVADDLESNPICPSCGFRPTEESGGPSGSVVLTHIDDELDKLIENWTTTLIENLDDPTAKASIKLLDEGEKKQVKKFLKDKALPEGKIPTELIKGIENALSGLTPVAVKPSALLESLGAGSAPCTVDQFEDRFKQFVNELTQGQDKQKLRIVIEKES